MRSLGVFSERVGKGRTLTGFGSKGGSSEVVTEWGVIGGQQNRNRLRVYWKRDIREWNLVRVKNIPTHNVILYISCYLLIRSYC